MHEADLVARVCAPSSGSYSEAFVHSVRESAASGVAAAKYNTAAASEIKRCSCVVFSVAVSGSTSSYITELHADAAFVVSNNG